MKVDFTAQMRPVWHDITLSFFTTYWLPWWRSSLYPFNVKSIVG